MAAQDRLGADFEFERHNTEVAACWEAFRSGKAYRVPIVVGTNTRYFMFHPEANPEGLSFREYSDDPDKMFDAQLKFARWARMNILQDGELGLPKRWWIGVDLQNYHEAAWFGCDIAYIDDQVPDTLPSFADCPERVMEHGIPDPFGGIMGRGLQMYDHFRARAERETYIDRPIDVGFPWFGQGSDGPMTVACNVFGPVFVCTTMAADPDRLHRLFDFITESTIARMTAYRERAGTSIPQENFGIADDSIALISTRMYREHVLPYHRKIYDTFGTPNGRSIHLCGDSTRHFLTLRDELGIYSFDTGFPVDFGRLRQELGPEVTINGGPHIELLRTSTPDEVRAEVRRILSTGILEGGRFMLREGNNLAPGTPLENTEAMYHAGREFGKLAPV